RELPPSAAQLILSVLIHIDRHGLLHFVSVQTHLEIDKAVGRVAALLLINSRPFVVDYRFAVQPGVDLTILVTGESRLEAEVEPTTAHFLLCGIEIGPEGA